MQTICDLASVVCYQNHNLPKVKAILAYRNNTICLIPVLWHLGWLSYPAGL